MVEWCGIESLYMAMNAPNIKTGTPTLPENLTLDPSKALFRILVPSVLLPLSLVVLFLGRTLPRTHFVLVASSVGYAISQGGLFGRPKTFPASTSCGGEWGATVGGILGGLLIGYLITRFAPRLQGLVVGGFFPFVVFHQFPNLNGVVTGFAALDNLKNLFLGWGVFAWLLTAGGALIGLFFLCWPKMKHMRNTLLVSLSCSWSITHSIRLILRDQQTFKDVIPLGWNIVILVGTFALLQILQVLFLIRWIRKKKIAQRIPIPLSRNVPNNVRQVFR